MNRRVSQTLSSRRRRAQRCRHASDLGQALTEYTVLFAGFSLVVLIGSAFVPDFLRAFQRYLDGFYFILNLPIP